MQKKTKKILWNKQYITVDNSSRLLYTVYCKGEEKRYAYYFESFLHGADLRAAHGADQIRNYQYSIKRRRGAPIRPFSSRISALTVKKAYDKLEEEGFVTTIHGKGTYVTASDKQLALEARQREAEADFEKAIDRALAMGMSREDILETVTLLLEEK